MEESEGATTSSDNAVWVNVGVTLLIVLLCALTGMALTQVTAPRIGRVKAVAQRLAQKDLTSNVVVTRDG